MTITLALRRNTHSLNTLLQMYYIFVKPLYFSPSFFLSIITFIVSGNEVGVETLIAVTAMMAATMRVRVLNLSLNDNKTGVLLGGYRDNLYLCHIVIR
ncbi:hypothetical protein [Prevotella sp. P4-51]|uniref:hypothetical protein n=1 Tax=Prevotella sp. P4-51 TaxID=2024228 RepID=UPI00117D8DA9|nr:hypothetical protein [Prevotella sp. P4-51]